MLPRTSITPAIFRRTSIGLHGRVFARFGYNQRRQDLLRGLLAALQSLKAAGCVNVYIDEGLVPGRHAGDFDGAGKSAT